MAAARKRYRRIRRTAAALAECALALLEVRRQAAIRNVLDLWRREHGSDRRICPEPPRRIAGAMWTFRRSRRRRWTTLASQGRRSAQSRRVFLRPPPENLIASEIDCARHDAARGMSPMSRLGLGLFCAAL